MDDLPPSPAQLPHHLLAHPAFVRALRERDFTTVFAMAHAAGISFNRIAEACALKAERVSQTARGAASVTALATVERIAGGLRIPGALLGLAAQPWEDTAVLSTESHHGDDPMKRRNLLRGTLAAGLTTPALAALTAARTDVDQTLSPDTPQDLADLEAAAESYGYGYHGQPPTRVLADLVTDFTALRPLLTVPQPAPVRARLCRTAGQMAGMTAIVLHDLGSRRESRAWFATAARAAAESGDHQLHSWVLAREAMVPLNYGAPKAAARLAEQARRTVSVGRPTSAATLAAAVAARAYALNHQPEHARHALAAADALMERLPECERSDTWLTYSEQKHHVHLSHAYTTLGDTPRAQESQQRALELSAPTSSMTRTLLNIDAAACAHHDGDTAQACHRAVAALTVLPREYRTGLVRRRALDLYEAIPAQHHQERAVRELRNVLAA